MNASLRFDRFELRPVERQLLRDGEHVRLGARAFDVLLTLVKGRGRLVTKDELLDSAWHGLVVEEANVQVQMSTLRKVLGAAAVATVPGLGYRFAVALEGAAVPPEAAPAGAPAGPVRTNLAPVHDELFGRGDELAALRAALAAHRPVTIGGAGGIGKTRLARAAASAVLDDYPRGVWWVDLAALADPAQLAPAIAVSAGLPLGDEAGAPALVRALAGQRLLLVLDNGEHLVGPLAALVRALLDGTGGVAVLVTSQEPLKLAGEQVLPLQPLALPAADATPGQARHSPALQLFEARAVATDRRFALTDANTAQAVALCRRLDGLALAIEMAAARAPLLGLEVLDRQLAERLDRLHAPQRDAPSRHRTLRQTLDWSHALLSADEAAVLRRLAVFAGSFRLEAAQVTAAGAGLDGWAVADALEGLVGKSLVRLEQVDPPRYRLLETTRMYARERLARAGEAESAQRRHVDAMARIAEEAEALALERSWRDCLVRYRPDHDDFEQAFDEACAGGPADAAAALASVLRGLDNCRGLITSSGRRALRLAPLVDAAGPKGRARLLTFIASCGWVDVPGWPRVAAAREAVDLWRSFADAWRLHSALAILATESSRVADFGAAQAALDEAQRLEEPGWPPRKIAVRLVHDGWVARFCGDPARSLDSMRRSIEHFERDGETEFAGAVRLELASALLRAGHPAEAAACSERSVAELRGLGQVERLGIALVTLAEAALMAGEVERARAAAVQALATVQPDDAVDELLVVVAALAAGQGQAEAAGRLLGHLQATERAATHFADAAGALQAAFISIERVLDGAARQRALDDGAGLDAAAAWRLARSLL